MGKMQPLILAACTLAAARGGSSQVAAEISSASPRNPPRRWAPASTLPAAFLQSPLARDAASSGWRPSTFVPALPSQFGHERCTSASHAPSLFCNPNRRHGGQVFATSSLGTLRRGNEDRRRRSACATLFAKPALEEDVSLQSSEAEADAIDVLGGEVASNVGANRSPNNLSTASAEGPVATIAIDAGSDDQSIPKEFIPILALCVLVTFLSALDRVAMSIAILPMASEFGLTETVKGQISSAVSYGYGAAILPVGLAVSVASPRLLMVVGVLLWSLATLGTPWMAEFTNPGVGEAGMVLLLPLLSIRAVMGAAEAVVLPTMQRVLANWVPPEKKATALAIVISGFQLGTVGAYLVSPLILDFMSGLDGGPANVPGWRGMFLIYGLAGLLWIVPWWLIAKDAPTAMQYDDEECEETLVNSGVADDASLVLNECEIEFEAEADSTGAARIRQAQSVIQLAPWKDFLNSPGVWGMTLAHAAKNWELYNLLAWTPTFFSEQYGLNVKESAAFSVLPSICGMIGGLTAGTIADYVLSNFVDECDIDDEGKDCESEKRTQVRKIFQSVALLGPATCLYLLSSLPEQAATAQLLLGGAVGLQAFDAAGFGAATQEKAGERWAGLLYSLTSLPGVMVGSISVSATGQILDAMAGDEGAGWTAVFQLNAAVCVVGALAFLALYDSKKEFE